MSLILRSISESMAPLCRRCVVTAKQAAVKKYVVKLSEAERERLNTLIGKGKHRARQLVKARILLKADTSEAGEGWSDSQIAVALDTSVDTVARTRQQLVEEGFEAVLIRKHSPASARKRIFDGAAEAKLVAVACSKPPTGRARWTLKLLEEAVVELNIVERASDNTIGRTLKKIRSSPTSKSNGSSRRTPTLRS
jgi:transposase